LVTLDRWIRDRARLTPDRIAIDFEGREVTYAWLEERSDELARGFSHGDRIATLTGNAPEHVAIFWACAKAGAIFTPSCVYCSSLKPLFRPAPCSSHTSWPRLTRSPAAAGTSATRPSSGEGGA